MSLGQGDSSDSRSPSIKMELDVAFLRSIRGILKVGELVTAFVAMVCFATAAGSTYIAASCLELLITAALLVLYVLKLNKKFTFFFWPLIDVFNSVFAAIFMFIICVTAVSLHSAKGILGGGIVGLMATALWCGDAFLLFRRITFNQARTTSVQRK
ncbi:proteolipid protein 2 isoform X1 [Anguilla rostrata]